MSLPEGTDSNGLIFLTFFCHDAVIQFLVFMPMFDV